MFRAALAVLLLLFAPLAGAQLLVTRGAEQPVRLQSVRVDTEIAGGLALTRVEMLFFNPNGRILEGELQFPLLDGQSIAGFALDIDGKLREAVPVDKARGQAVFEDITRQRIDPALLSHTQGNNFKLRVYPLPPRGTRTVVVRYGETMASAQGRRTYRLPLGYSRDAHAFSFNVRVKQAGAAPQGALAFQRSGMDWVASHEGTIPGSGMIELSMAAARSPVAYTQEANGKTWFFAEIPVPAERAPRPAPKAVAIAWDSSGSGEGRDHAKELALLGAYLRWMRNGEVVLVRLRDRADAPEHFTVKNGDWRALRRALESTVYDGATQLGAFHAPAEAEEVLLFSDGLSNFGERGLRANGKPVHAISASMRADPAALRALAEASGGRYADLLSDSPAAAVAMLTTRSTRIESIEAEGATDIVRESGHPREGRVAVAGVLQRRNAQLRVTLALPRGGSRIVELPIRTARTPGALAAGLWARLRLAELEGDYDLHKAEIRRIGKAFGLVTRETSLIVLDRVEDYVRHEIVPPAELRAEYDRLMQVAVRRRETDRAAHIARIVKQFEEKQAWWSREFPKEAKPAQIARDSREDRAESSVQRAPASAGMRGSAAAPAARALAAPSRLAELDAAAPAGGGIAIRLRPWTPDAPYARRLRDADSKDAYRVYLDERRDHASSTAFYLDAADLLLEKGQKLLALRVLSNLAEMDLENRHVLRILGHRLMQAGEPGLAVAVFRKVLDLSPEEPQSWRDLGLAFAAGRQHQKAVEALYEVVSRPWHGRFPDIELTALAELNAIVATASENLDTRRFDPRLLKNLPLDLRVVLTWDADNTDIDLWVTDPNGEKSYYGNRLSYQGGRMSQDFTGGYGPEEFSLRRAKPGKYRVEAQFYGHRQQIVAGATTLQLNLSTGFGTKAVQEKAVTLRLKGQSEVVLVGEFEVK